MNSKKIYAYISIAVLVIATSASLGYFYGTKKFQRNIENNNTLVGVKNNNGIFVYNVINDKSTEYAKTEINFPQVEGASVEFNKSISDFINSAVDSHNKNAEENWKARVETAMPGDNISKLPTEDDKFTITGNWQLAQLNDNYVSLIVSYYDFSGGAHGQTIVKSFNYDFKNKKIMNISDLYPGDANYLQKVSKSAIDALNEKYVKPGYTDKTQVEEGAGPNIQNFENFTFENQFSIKLYFQDYQVGPHAMGMPVVEIYPERN